MDLEMGATCLDPGSSRMGKKESIEDTVRVLGRMHDGIEDRGLAQSIAEDLAANAGVPARNGLTTEMEVEDRVFESSRPKVFDEAENRTHIVMTYFFDVALVFRRIMVPPLAGTAVYEIMSALESILLGAGLLLFAIGPPQRSAVKSGVPRDRRAD